MSLQEFPRVKLSYESFIHKKVFDADIVLAIPEGKKCFAWFTSENNRNVCYVMEISGNNQIKRISLVNVCFNSVLSYGTIFYGTLSVFEKNRFFSVEDILFCKGKDIQHINYISKLRILETIFAKDIRQISYNNAFVIFGLPRMSLNLESLISSQKVAYYQYRYFYKSAIYNIRAESYGILLQEPSITVNRCPPPHPHPLPRSAPQPKRREYTPMNERTFKVKPDIQNDIYHLYDANANANANADTILGTAYIPDYITSVMMNKIFRNIKENDNLDALEESDSEEEFENDKLDKFVYLDREEYMICTYHNKFKKWVPLRKITI